MEQILSKRARAWDQQAVTYVPQSV